MGLKDIISGAAGGLLWKVGAFAGLAGCVVLTGLLIAEKADNGRLTTQVGALTKQINDPETGYVVRLAQCRTNTAQLETALDSQNAAIDAQSKTDQAKLAAAQKALADARETIQWLRNSAAAMLEYKPQGATACERAQDVINHYFARADPKITSSQRGDRE